MRWSLVCREPYRLLFPLGVLFGLHGTGHWLAYAVGRSDAYSGFYHAFVQIAGYLYCFIAGFLLTALPRVTAAAPATTGELAAILALLAAQFAAATLGRWIVAEACFAGLLVTLAVFARRRFAARRTEVAPPAEFVWIPVSLLLGLGGAALLALGQAGWLPPVSLAIGRPMLQQGFVLGIVAGVGGFMVPRLLGRVGLRARRRLTHLAAAGVFAASFVLEGIGWIALAYGVRAAVLTGVFVWTSRFYRPPSTKDGYVRMLWVSVWLIVLGLWGAALAPQYRVPMLHIVFLGGISLMTFAVATMVVLSHAGEAARLQRPVWALKAVGAGIAAALVARLAADQVPSRYFQLLGIASTAWMLGGGLWLAFILPYLARTASPELLARHHEAAKRRVLNPDAC